MELINLTALAVSVLLGLIAAGCLTALMLLPMQAIRKRLGAFIIRLFGGVPWLDRDQVVFGDGPGRHQTFFVSRHALAEGGLECPICKNPVAASGDFSRVQRTMVDGLENECILCLGERLVEGTQLVPCRTVLLASPDTEHGDHLNENGEVDAYAPDPPAYFRFVRAPADQHLREKWGVEARDAGGTDVDVPVPRDAPPAGRRDDVLTTMPNCMTLDNAPSIDPSRAPTDILPAIRKTPKAP